MQSLNLTPAYSLDDKNVIVSLSFYHVYINLKGHLATVAYIDDEDFDKLFEIVIQSYFSEDSPNSILYTWLCDNGFPTDAYERYATDMAIEIIHGIIETTNLMLPGLFRPGVMPELDLPIENLTFHNKYVVLLELSKAAVAYLSGKKK